MASAVTREHRACGARRAGLACTAPGKASGLGVPSLGLKGWAQFCQFEETQPHTQAQRACGAWRRSQGTVPPGGRGGVEEQAGLGIAGRPLSIIF